MGELVVGVWGVAPSWRRCSRRSFSVPDDGRQRFTRADAAPCVHALAPGAPADLFAGAPPRPPPRPMAASKPTTEDPRSHVLWPGCDESGGP